MKLSDFIRNVCRCMRRQYLSRLVLLAVLVSPLCAPLSADTFSRETENAARKLTAGLSRGMAQAVAVVKVASPWQGVSDAVEQALYSACVRKFGDKAVLPRRQNPAAATQSGSLEALREAGIRLGADCVIYGECYKTGTDLTVSLRAMRVSNKEVLASWSTVIDGSDSELAALMRGTSARTSSVRASGSASGWAAYNDTVLPFQEKGGGVHTRTMRIPNKFLDDEAENGIYDSRSNPDEAAGYTETTVTYKLDDMDLVLQSDLVLFGKRVAKKGALLFTYDKSDVLDFDGIEEYWPDNCQYIYTDVADNEEHDCFVFVTSADDPGTIILWGKF